MTTANPYPMHAAGSEGLAELLERVLDKGVVIAGDIQINLLDIELLTIKIRLLISSADKAEELGLGWWHNDPFFTGEASTAGELTERLGRIEDALGIPQADDRSPVANAAAVEQRTET